MSFRDKTAAQCIVASCKSWCRSVKRWNWRSKMIDDEKRKTEKGKGGDTRLKQVTSCVGEDKKRVTGPGLTAANVWRRSDRSVRSGRRGRRRAVNRFWGTTPESALP